MSGSSKLRILKLLRVSVSHLKFSCLGCTFAVVGGATLTSDLLNLVLSPVQVLPSAVGVFRVIK